MSGSAIRNASSALVHRIDLARQRRRLPPKEVAWRTPWLAPMQIRAEFEPLLELAEGARAVVEIGCYHGGTLFLLCGVAADDAVLVSVDVAMSRARMPLYRSFGRRTQRVHPLAADSHDPTTVATVEGLLDGRPVDLLLIDGDHSYEGVRRDYELWAPLVRSGGLIAFHDINPGLTAEGVPRLWHELGGGREFVAPDRAEGGFGIGVLVR